MCGASDPGQFYAVVVNAGGNQGCVSSGCTQVVMIGMMFLI